jgi:hypothetical protein
MTFTRNSKGSFAQIVLSPNYFQAKCIKTTPKNIQEFENLIKIEKKKVGNVSIFLDGRSAVKVFSHFEKKVPSEKFRIIIHRTDLIPETDHFERMKSLGFELQSVNWLGDTNLCTPIPIGLQPEVLKPSVLDYIETEIKSRNGHLRKKKKYKFYVNFDITTNISIRKKVLLSFIDDEQCYFPGRRLSIFEHLAAMRQSEFVISPPGAGPDCYRTWEAIYMGSTPIVLENSWNFVKTVPNVLTVKNYDDITSHPNKYKTPEELEFGIDYYHTLVKKFD